MTLKQTHLHAETLHEVPWLYEMRDSLVLCGDGDLAVSTYSLTYVTVRLYGRYITRTELFLHVKALCSDAQSQRHRWSQK